MVAASHRPDRGVVTDVFLGGPADDVDPKRPTPPPDALCYHLYELPPPPRPLAPEQTGGGDATGRRGLERSKFPHPSSRYRTLGGVCGGRASAQEQQMGGRRTLSGRVGVVCVCVCVCVCVWVGVFVFLAEFVLLLYLLCVGSIGCLDCCRL